MREVYYPSTNEKGEGKPTLVSDWIQAIYWNLQRLHTERKGFFIGADIPIFADRDQPETYLRPGVFVACDRPKGPRRGYRVWEEENRFPDVVFLVISDHWRFGDLSATVADYDRRGVRELYIFNPFTPMFLDGFRRVGEGLIPISIQERDDFCSPILGIRVVTKCGFVEFFDPDGSKWISLRELSSAQPSSIAQ